jgi:hypothetical protein
MEDLAKLAANLADIQRIVQEIDAWTDAKVASGVPLTQGESDLLAAIQEKYAELKRGLTITKAELAAERSRQESPNAD